MYISLNIKINMDSIKQPVFKLLILSKWFPTLTRKKIYLEMHIISLKLTCFIESGCSYADTDVGSSTTYEQAKVSYLKILHS